MGVDKFDLSSLVAATEPRENIITAKYSAFADTGSETAQIRCAICGTPDTDAHELAIGYANPVCKACDELAVNEEGAEPWTGWKPGNEPESEPGVIQLSPDQGENPVYIAGAKCWRRYRFGGHVTRRDGFDCDSLEQFQQRHRVDGEWIHAFNSPEPNGVSVSKEVYQQLRDREQEVQSLRDGLDRIIEGDSTELRFEDIQQRVQTIGGRLPTQVEKEVDSGEVPLKEYATSVRRAVVWTERTRQDMLGLHRRYFES